jgi:hypothetical protein
MYGSKRDWVLQEPTRVLVLEDYLGAEARRAALYTELPRRRWLAREKRDPL